MCITGQNRLACPRMQGWDCTSFQRPALGGKPQIQCWYSSRRKVKKYSLLLNFLVQTPLVIFKNEWCVLLLLAQKSTPMSSKGPQVHTNGESQGRASTCCPTIGQWWGQSREVKRRNQEQCFLAFLRQDRQGKLMKRLPGPAVCLSGSLREKQRRKMLREAENSGARRGVTWLLRAMRFANHSQLLSLL